MSVADEIIRLQTAKADIKTAIEEKGVTIQKTELLNEYPPKIDEVYEAGKKAQHDAFWDNFQHNQTHLCYFPYWHRDCFYPKYSMVLKNRQAENFMLFDNYSDYTVGFDFAERLEECGITIDFSQATQTIRCFQNTKISRLPELDFSSSNNLSNCFSTNKYLKTIDKLIISEKAVFENTFNNCPLLEDLTIEGTIANDIDLSSCTSLSGDTIYLQVGLNLKDYSSDASGTKHTLTINSTQETAIGEDRLGYLVYKGWNVSVV